MTACKLRLSAVLGLIGGLALLLGGCIGGGLPVISVLNVPTTVVEGSTVTITVQATSGGGGPIIYSWTATCGGTFVPNPSDPIPSGQTHTVQWTTPAVTADTPCTVRVTATSRGRSSTANRNTTVLRIPEVVSVVPAPNATAVPVTTDIIVTFDGPMAPASVVLTCVSESSGACNMTISAPVWSAGNSVATYTVGDPDAPFPANLEFLETYSMRVVGNSSAGVPMAAPYEWSFTTATANPPVISSMTVPSSVVEGTTGHTVSVVASDSAPLSYSWSASGPGVCSSITFNPNNSQAASTSTMTVPTIPSTPLPRADLNCTISVTVSGPGGSTSDSRPSTVRRIPFVVSTIPNNLQTGVLVTTEVQITFDGSMDPASLALLCTNEGPASFPVTGTPCNMTFGTPAWSDAYSGTAPNSRVDVTVGDPDATPPTNLEYQRGYKLQVNANSASGVAMAAAHSWEFATEAAPIGRIVIDKTALGGDATFDFTTSGTGGLPASFQITTSSGSGSQTFNNIAPGTYTVTESNPPAGWDFTDLVCVDPDGGTTVDIGTRTATIDLDTGEIITCTYTNTRRGTIVINKTAVGGDGTFNYTGDLGAFSITTSGGSGSQTFTDVVPGTYAVTEDTPPANWNLTSLTCVDPDNGTTTAGPTATIDLDPGETVTCTYTNTYVPPVLPQCPANVVDEAAEPGGDFGNDAATAKPLDLTPGQGVAIVKGGITPAGDLDYFQITVTVPSLVFASVRTNIATGSADSTLFIGVNPVTTGSGCSGTGFTECDDDDGDQGALSSSISGLNLSPGTYYILVKQYGGTATMTPYRLYVAVVPTANVISESEPNDTPSTGYTVTSCPFVVTGTGGGTGSNDYYRFTIPGGNSVLWVSALQATGWDSRLELWADIPTPVQIPWVGASGSPHCNGSGLTAPISESCSKDYDYQSSDTWPNWPQDYAVNIRPVSSPTGTGGTYTMLVVVMNDVGTPPSPPPAAPPTLTACPSNVTSEAEPNEDATQATALNLAPGNGTVIVDGGIGSTTDRDWYSFTLTAADVPALLFAYVRNSNASTSGTAILKFHPTSPDTGTSCTTNPGLECDDGHGGQGSSSAAIAGHLITTAGTYYLEVIESGVNATMTPYRLYVAVVPQSAVIAESEPNDSPVLGNDVTACPAVFSGTSTGTGSEDYFRFQLPAGTYILWAIVDEVPGTQQPPAPRSGTGWDSVLQLWVANTYPFFAQRSWIGTGATVPNTTAAANCDSAITSGTPAESCSVDQVYQAADTWPGAGVYAVNVRPYSSGAGSYRVLIVVWPAAP